MAADRGLIPVGGRFGHLPQGRHFQIVEVWALAYTSFKRPLRAQG